MSFSKKRTTTATFRQYLTASDNLSPGAALYRTCYGGVCSDARSGLMGEWHGPSSRQTCWGIPTQTPNSGMPGGETVSSLWLATFCSYRCYDGEWAEEIEWHDVVVWKADRLAERADCPRKGIRFTSRDACGHAAGRAGTAACTSERRWPASPAT